MWNLSNQKTDTDNHETHTRTNSFSAAAEWSVGYLSAAPVNEAIYVPHSVSGSRFVSPTVFVSASVTTDISIRPSNHFLKGQQIRFLLPHGTKRLQFNSCVRDLEQVSWFWYSRCSVAKRNTGQRLSQNFLRNLKNEAVIPNFTEANSTTLSWQNFTNFTAAIRNTLSIRYLKSLLFKPFFVFFGCCQDAVNENQITSCRSFLLKEFQQPKGQSPSLSW